MSETNETIILKYHAARRLRAKLFSIEPLSSGKMPSSYRKANEAYWEACCELATLTGVGVAHVAAYINGERLDWLLSHAEKASTA